MIVCANCGQENPDGFAFCGRCGKALATEPERRREERKVVTVVFCDVVGSTARAEGADPEDVRAALSAFYERVRSELERFGGTVEKFIGDAVMAVFGAPVVHEDDPERAVRAALAIRDWAREEGAMQVRLAVNTGEALVAVGARADSGEAMVAGDVVNTAARLQSAAPVNGVLVGEQTYAATERVIDYLPAEPVEAKGKAAPVAAWEALEPRARFGEDVEITARTALVGREAELEQLTGALARARGERAPQLVTLVGVPGIGKSRLVGELFAVTDADPDFITWRQGRSLPYGEGVSLWALGEMVKAQAGLQENDSAEEAGAKVASAVADLLPEAAEARWVESHLQALVGLGADTGSDSRSEAFSAWRRFLEALAEVGPLVLVFEDLHWADDAMLDFVDYLVDWATDVPLLVVGTARPELLERRSGWGGGKRNALTISLAPLSSTETARLVAQRLGRAVLPAEVQAALLERAEGNPLYAEEYARTVAAGGEAGLQVPLSLQGLIAARLDALPGDEKNALQVAAVLGKVFWLSALASLGGDEPFALEERLHRLERKEFVRRERRSSVGGETQYAFLHALVREVAYGQIPRAQRVELHRAAAGWIGSLAPDRSEDRAEMLAFHYGEALRLGEAAGVDTSAIVEPARAAFREAGDRALALNAQMAARSFYDAAFDLCPEGDPERPLLVIAAGRAGVASGDQALFERLAAARDELLETGRVDPAAEADALLAVFHWERGDRDTAYAYADHAVELLPTLTSAGTRGSVLAARARLAMLGGDETAAVRFSRAALEAAGAEDTGLRCNTLVTLGTARVHDGDLGGFEDLGRALELARETTSVDGMRRALNNMANLDWDLGRLDEAAELIVELRALAERFAQPEDLRWTLGEEVFDRHLRGRWRECERLADEFIAGAEQHSHYLEAPVRATRGRVRLTRDDLGGAEADMRRAVELARRQKDFQVVEPILVFHAELLALTGRRDEAGAVVDEALALGASQPWAHRLILALLAPELDRVDEVRESLQRTVSSPWSALGLDALDGDAAGVADALARMGARGEEARVRLAWAGLLAGEGRRAEADAQLQQALAFFREEGAVRFLREGEALLAAAS